MNTTDFGEDPPAPGEDSAIRTIAAALEAVVRREYPPGTTARRDAHPKHHGCVRAQVTVGDDVPEDLRHGVFARPQSYPAWIRFSNGSPIPKPDARRDQRGMAIKLLNVPGAKVLEADRHATTQDFVLASYPRFFIRNVADYLEFTRAASRRPHFMVFGFFFARPPWNWRLHELGTLIASLQPAEDLLALRYWSQTPYRLGPHAVKYSARPLRAAHETPLASSSPDFLRERLAAHLKTREAVFELMVQRRSDGMSIEDSTVEWGEARSPFRRVATITIPPQTFESSAQMAFAENIAYTPWHTLPEHAPLGAINRVRRIVYEGVSRLRHELNGVRDADPIEFAD
jgi:hypothetical protein